MNVIRGTTPTIKYTFKTIQATDIVAAYLTVRQAEEVVIEKDISAATASETELYWTLTQTDTLKLIAGVPAYFRCNWKITDGTRGASKLAIATVEENDKSGVI